MKISLFVSTLDSNPIVRAKPLADALIALGHQVEVLGLLLEGDQVYEPYRDAFDYITLKSKRSIRDVRKKARMLAVRASGDAVYAFKPLQTSFYPALLYSGFGKKRPLFLDVEDDDVFAFGPAGLRSLARLSLKGWEKSTDYKYSIWLHRHLRTCRAVTVASGRLQQIYGGDIVLHGPQPPDRDIPVGSPEQAILREKLKIPVGKIAVLFAGVARPHKGFDILQAASQSDFFRTKCQLVLAGDPDQELFRAAKDSMGPACTLTGQFSAQRVHEVVQACDLVPVLQNKERYTESQIPGKMLEAFACSRPVIGTNIGDLPRLIGKGRTNNGWIIAPRQYDVFEQVLREIDGDRINLLSTKGQAAKAFFDQNCSKDAVTRRLSKVFASL